MDTGPDTDSVEPRASDAIILEAAEETAALPPAETQPVLEAAHGSEGASTAEPEPTASPQSGNEAVTVAGFEASRPRLVTGAFVAYVLVWLAMAAALAYHLLELPPSTAVYEAPFYEATLWVAIGLLGTGVLMVPIVWLIARAQTSDRTGLFASVAFTGGVAVLVGAGLWWAALAAVDYLRLGRVY